MDLLLTLALSFVLLLVSVFKGYFIAYPLLLCLAMLISTLVRRGIPLKTLISIGFASSQKSFSVLIILLLIGAVTAIWIAAGTVPALVYYGTQFLNPRYFVFSAFLLSSFISLLLGTSFGTVSTIGVALMVMARSGNIDTHLVAGAIIAGAYFGDRCSPMSSSANLIASLTKTGLYKNIKIMMKTTWLPFILSSLLYFLLSLLHPIQAVHNLASEIPLFFKINLFVLLPALVILVLSVLRVEVKIALTLSLASGIWTGMIFQEHSFLQLIQFALSGFALESAPHSVSILAGGGVVSMVKVAIVVILSTALAGIIAETKMLAMVETCLKRFSTRSNLFLGTTLIGLATAAFGCTQTIAILMTQQLVKRKYEQEQLDRYQLAADIENTAVVLSPLIPWNIAGLVPATILMTDSGFIPYAFYLYLLPLCNLIQFKLTDSMQEKYASKLID
jgi:NhaC family Na+:H+ antiporter